jgi:DnaJ-domain-containing protein 1
VIDVLYFSDRQVQSRLFQLVEQTPGLMVVTVMRHPPGSAPVERREPFRTLEARFGEVVHFVVLADEGSPDGMWRDPMGNLCDRVYPHDKNAAYEASRGYLLLCDGHALGSVPKGPDGGRTDMWALQDALAEQDGRIPYPDPAQKPRAEASGVGGGAANRARPGMGRNTPVDTPVETPAIINTVAAKQNPYALLGISEDMTRGEAKKAYRAKLSLYHPDKVAHLADEFRELAESRTRALMEAWAEIEGFLVD